MLLNHNTNSTESIPDEWIRPGSFAATVVTIEELAALHGVEIGRRADLVRGVKTSGGRKSAGQAGKGVRR